MSTETLEITTDITSATLEVIHRDVDDLINDGLINITFDMAKVDIVDSTGIGFIIRVQNSLKQHGGTLNLRGVNNDIFKMMKIMRLEKHFSIES
jgi:anti-anti-sigma factor